MSLGRFLRVSLSLRFGIDISDPDLTAHQIVDDMHQRFSHCTLVSEQGERSLLHLDPEPCADVRCFEKSFQRRRRHFASQFWRNVTTLLEEIKGLKMRLAIAARLVSR